MKTLKYILIPALTGILFTACNTEPKGPTQAEIDTQVDAQVQTATDQLKADCDMRLMQAAQMQADSMLAKGGSTTKPTTPLPPKTRTTTTTKTTVTPPPPPVNPKSDRFNNNGGKTVNDEDTKKKEDRFDNNGKKEVTPADTKKKDDRFKK